MARPRPVGSAKGVAQVVPIRFSVEELAALRKRAKKEGTTVSALVRGAVGNVLSN